MPSLIPGFEYDVFISYRQNDNRSAWVTEFVKNLQEELAATIKGSVSVYFDSNPTDGLLETHDVDDSLKGKLKSYILIPVISQTYCDVNCFAWKHEFIAFKRNTEHDGVGLKVKLGNGNVASRILPVCIHDLDEDDKKLIEDELGSVLRGIEFIYKTNGVVRPLKPLEEDSKSNLNHTYYRDQINKVARAIKDLITARSSLTHQTSQPVAEQNTLPKTSKRKIAFIAVIIGLLGVASFVYYYYGGVGSQLREVSGSSIAVLPFENMNKDPAQDYFSDGIAEDILNHLTKISDLKVKSRTSTLQYKGTQKTMSEIGEELGVSNVVEGSVRLVGDKVRIVVQLIDAETDVHLWSETYDRELADVLALQSEIAIEIANILKARLTPVEKESIEKEPSQNVTAYDYYLRARDIINKTNGIKSDFENALLLVNSALRRDPKFSRAYALKADIWFNLGFFGAPQKVWQDSSLYFSTRAISEDRSSPDGYVSRGWIYRYLGDLKNMKENFYSAFKLAPNNAEVLYAYGVQLLRDRDEKGADLVLKSIGNRYSLKDPQFYNEWTNVYSLIDDFDAQEKLCASAKELNPGSVGPYLMLAALYRNKHLYEKTLHEMEQAHKINPTDHGIIDGLAWANYMTNNLEKAAEYWSKYMEIESTFEDSTQTVPFRHRLGMVYSKMGRKKEADALFHEDLKIQSELISSKRGIGAWGGQANIYYDLAIDNTYFGEHTKAVQYLDSALNLPWMWKWGFYNDPMLEPLRQRDDFKKIMKTVDEYYEFRKKAFTNALSRMEASNELKNLLK